MNYEVKYHNDFTEKSYLHPESIWRHIDNETYIVSSLSLAKDVINDLLDAPKTEMTDEEIRESFSSSKCQLSPEKVHEIASYYNGRLGIMKQIEADIKNADDGATVNLFYSIPSECNQFSVVDESNPVQNAAYISIQSTDLPIGS